MLDMKSCWKNYIKKKKQDLWKTQLLTNKHWQIQGVWVGLGRGGSETPPHSPKDFFNKHQYDVHKYEMLKLGYKTTLLFNKGVKYTTKTHTEIIFCLNAHNTKGNCGSLVWLRGGGIVSLCSYLSFLQLNLLVHVSKLKHCLFFKWINCNFYVQFLFS